MNGYTNQPPPPSPAPAPQLAPARRPFAEPHLAIAPDFGHLEAIAVRWRHPAIPGFGRRRLAEVRTWMVSPVGCGVTTAHGSRSSRAMHSRDARTNHRPQALRGGHAHGAVLAEPGQRKTVSLPPAGPWTHGGPGRVAGLSERSPPWTGETQPSNIFVCIYLPQCVSAASAPLTFHLPFRFGVPHSHWGWMAGWLAWIPAAVHKPVRSLARLTTLSDAPVQRACACIASGLSQKLLIALLSDSKQPHSRGPFREISQSASRRIPL